MAEMVQTVFPSMGTLNTITVFDGHRTEVDAAREYILGLDRRLSVFRPDSELSRLNILGGGKWMTVSEDTFEIFLTGVFCSELTGGAFDITAGPLAALWKDAIRVKRLPDEAEILSRKALVDYRDISLDWEQHRVRLEKDCQSVDFGGIAKGYVADKLTRMLSEAGVKEAVINLGGTVGVMGSPHWIGIQDPLRPTGEALGMLRLENAFAVTSGGYERGFDLNGVRYHHIIDPRSGYPSRSGLLSVTLVGERAAELDALATAVFILGAEKALPILHNRNIQATFVTETGEVFLTPGLRKSFQILYRKGA